MLFAGGILSYPQPMIDVLLWYRPSEIPIALALLYGFDIILFFFDVHANIYYLFVMFCMSGLCAVEHFSLQVTYDLLFQADCSWEK